ncbi:MAG: hypothetical protein FWC92_04760 [Defluviitaleaceae bacterium]|nr:hypothetical protein [Defluviitaleaceae bacterium]
MNYKKHEPARPSFKPAKSKERKNKGLMRALTAFLALFIVAGIAVFALDNDSGEILYEVGPMYTYVDYSHEYDYHHHHAYDYAHGYQQHGYDAYDYDVPHYGHDAHDHGIQHYGHDMYDYDNYAAYYESTGPVYDYFYDAGHEYDGGNYYDTSDPSAPDYDHYQDHNQEYTPQGPSYYEPTEMVSVGHDNAPVYLSIDENIHINLHSQGSQIGFSYMFDAYGYVHVRIPTVIEEQDIRVTMPYGWTHDVDHGVLYAEQWRYCGEYNCYCDYYNENDDNESPLARLSAFDSNEYEEPDYIEYTVVSFGGFTPFSTWPAGMDLTGVNIRDVTVGDGGAAAVGSLSWGMSATGNASPRAVRLMNDITITGDARAAAAGITHIFSDTLTLDEAFRITRTGGDGRHLSVGAGNTLRIWNATIDRPPSAAYLARAICASLACTYPRDYCGASICDPALPAAERCVGVSTCFAYTCGVMPTTQASAAISGGPATTGGGIHVTGAGARLYLHNGSSIRYNRMINSGTAAGSPRGGGVQVNTSGVVTVLPGAEIRHNASGGTGTGGGGGGISLRLGGSRGYMEGGQIIYNHSEQVGGGVQMGGAGPTGASTFTMTGGEISYNVTNTSGGGLQTNDGGSFVFDGVLRINGNRALGTLATQGGGGIRMYSSSSTTINLAGGSQITNNFSGAHGGGISMLGTGQGVIANDTIFEGNTAGRFGGAIHAAATLTAGGSGNDRRVIDISNSTFRNNTAQHGGAIFMAPGANLPDSGTTQTTRLLLTNDVIFSGNIASGGMRVDEGLAHRNRVNITNTGSLTWLGVNPLNTGVIVERNHIFNNYDVNPTGGTAAAPVGGSNWSYLREIQYAMTGTAAGDCYYGDNCSDCDNNIDHTNMRAWLYQMTRPRGDGGAGTFIVLPAPLLIPNGTLVVVGGTGGTARASATHVRYEVLDRELSNLPGPEPRPTSTRIINWFRRQTTSSLALTGVTPARTVDHYPVPAPATPTAPRLIANPFTPDFDAFNRDLHPIADRVEVQIEYYHEVTFIVETGGVNEGTTRTPNPFMVREGTTIASSEAVIPSTATLFGFDFVRWEFALKSAPTVWACITTLPGINTIADFPNLVITAPITFVARMNGFSDWARLNSVINPHANSSLPLFNNIVIHPATPTSPLVNEDWYDIPSSTYHLVIRDPQPVPNPGAAGTTITTIQINGAPAAHPHRIQVGRAVTITAAGGSNINLLMAVPQGTTVVPGVYQTSGAVHWVTTLENPGRHFVVTADGTNDGALTLGSGITIHGNNPNQRPPELHQPTPIPGSSPTPQIPAPGTGSVFSDVADRGGINVIDGGDLIMQNNSAVRNSRRADTSGGATAVGGGGISVVGVGSTLTLNTGSEVFNNVARFNGGGIFASAGSAVIIDGGVIRNNIAMVSFNEGRPGDAYGGGGIRVNNATLTMHSGYIHNNNSHRGAGVRLHEGATFNMYNGEIHNNQADPNPDPSPRLDGSNGGGVLGHGSTFNMNGGRIHTNTARRMGGGVYMRSNSQFDMRNNAIIENNTATDNHGGGVWLDVNTNFVMHNRTSMVRDNRANNGGAGVQASNGSTVTIHDGTISGNYTTGTSGLYASGGGLRLHGTTGVMWDGLIYGNTATNGAGVWVGNNGNFTMHGGRIENNETTSTAVPPNNFIATTGFPLGGGGGGVLVHGPNAVFTMNGGDIYNNYSVRHGGGVHVTTNNPTGTPLAIGNGGTFNFNGGTIERNRARVGGGGISAQRAILNMSGDARVHNNTATNGSGGGVYVHSTGYTGTPSRVFTMDGGSITYNHAHVNGGGVFLNGAQTRFVMTAGTIGGVSGATPVRNTANNGGGLFLSPDTVAVVTGDINSNSATIDGGGAFVSDGANLTVNGQVHHNTAVRGAGIFVNGPGRATGASADLIGNIPIEVGGYIGDVPEESEEISPGIFAQVRNFFTGDGNTGIAPLSLAAATLTANNNSISYNTAGRDGANPTAGFGGGVWVAYGSQFNVNNVTFSTNHVHGTTGMGGAIYTQRYEYRSPLLHVTGWAGPESYSYSNIVFVGNTPSSFSGNTAPPRITPSNADEAIAFALFGGINNASGIAPYNRHILNNQDINFRLDEERFTFYKTDYRVYNYPYPINRLQGAHFRLYRAPRANVVGYDLITVSGGTHSPTFWTEITDATHPGKLERMESSISAGQPIAFFVTAGYMYQLVEVVAPIGYQVPNTQWRIWLEDGDFETDIIGDAFPFLDFTYHDYDGDEDVRFLGNFLAFELPLTGGTSSTHTTLLFTTGGIAFIGIAIASIFIFNNKSKKARPQ